MTPATPQRLGDFEILREIGRGGMGVVYEARQVSLNRNVALKVLSAGLGLTPKAVQRFHREAEAAAKLHHTNIVPVYATGEENGTHFYAMELIEGPSLDRVIKQLRQIREPRPELPCPTEGEKPESSLAATGPYVEAAEGSFSASELTSSSLGSGSHYFDSVARMIAEVADGLDYAHMQGVIHRDIKPSNLLMSPQGRLSINDFGLARILEQPGMTMTGEFVGTPAYMSPEQITAGRTPLDHRSDIYSLGATLYELLTLERPFAGKQRDQVLAQIIHKEPRPPRTVDKKVSVDLETICLKAMDKDPDRRYQTAGEMAEDLRRYVNRYAISARRAGPIRRGVKWVRRRPEVAAATFCAVLLVLVTGVFAFRAHVAERHRLVEQEEARKALLTEKRQSALDKAMAAAMSGDLRGTEMAIAQAEGVGASTGQVLMLRGLLALYQGDYDAGLRELEQANELLPDSVAARSLLAYLYSFTGQIGKSEEVWLQAEKLHPTTMEDYLFKGRVATQVGDLARGLQDLDEAIRIRDSIIGRAFRADVRATHAWQTADPNEAQKATSDIDVALGMAPENPDVISISIEAYLAAALAWEEIGQKEKADAALSVAAKGVSRLEHVDSLPGPVVSRLTYLLYTGQDDAFCELPRRESEQGKNDFIHWSYAWSLYRHGEFARALEVLGRCRSKDALFVELPRGYNLIELPGGVDRTLAVCKEQGNTAKDSNTIWSVHCLLLLLGRRAESTLVGRQYRGGGYYRGPNQWMVAQLDYLCGDLSAEELLRSAGRSKWAICSDSFIVALTKLSECDRDGAKQYFRKAVATRYVPTHSFPWSKAFLARMEKDPKWPPWIPVKK
jgi:tetratricopeptide (TPR) repeat protein